MNHSIGKWSRGRIIMRASPQVRQMVEVGQERHWRFQPMGRARVPEEPVYLRDWLVVPISQDSSQISDESQERVRALFEAGVRPKAFLIAHETPRALGAPPGTTHSQAKPSIDWPRLKEDGAERAKELAQRLPDLDALGPVLLGGLKVLGIAAAAVVVVPVALVGLLTAAVLVDPVLIAVTEDDYWVEIDRWWA